MNEVIINSLLVIVSIFPFGLFILELMDFTFFSTNRRLKNLKTICLGSNKTLIKNYYTIKNIIYNNLVIQVKNERNNNFSEDENLKLFSAITHLCEHKKTRHIEDAIKNFFDKNRLNKSIIEQTYRAIDKVPEYEGKKFSTTVVRKQDSKEIFALSKGNPHHLLEICTRILINDRKEEITPALRHKLKKQIKKITKKGQKIIAYAMRPLPLKKLDQYTVEFTEKEYILLGFITVKRPLNREIIKEIKLAKELKYKLYLLTQLKEKTAVSIAIEMGLINPHHFESISGEYFMTLTDQKIEKIFKDKEKDFVFYELDPEKKSLIMNKLNELKERTIWVDKKNSLQSINRGTNKRKTIDKNLNGIVLFSIINKIPLFVFVIASLFLGLPSIITFGFIVFQEILITFPALLTLRAKENLTNLTTNHLLLRNYIFTPILNFIMAFAIIYWNLSRNGFSLETNYFKSDYIFSSSITLLLIFFSFNQLLNIMPIFGLNAFKNKIFMLWTIIIGLSLYALINLPQAQFLLNTTKLSLTEYSVILLFFGINLAVSLIRLKPKEYA